MEYVNGGCERNVGHGNIAREGTNCCCSETLAGVVPAPQGSRLAGTDFRDCQGGAGLRPSISDRLLTASLAVQSPALRAISLSAETLSPAMGLGTRRHSSGGVRSGRIPPYFRPSARPFDLSGERDRREFAILTRRHANLNGVSWAAQEKRSRRVAGSSLCSQIAYAGCGPARTITTWEGIMTPSPGRRATGGRLGSSLFPVLISLTTFSAAAGEELKRLPSETGAEQVQMVGTVRHIALGPENTSATAFGVELSLLPGADDARPIHVTISCVLSEHTPELAISNQNLPAGSRLYNLTRPSAEGCASYEVSVRLSSHGGAQDGTNRPDGEVLAQSDSGASNEEVARPPIAIGIDHVGLPSDLTKTIDVGVFVFNPVSGNWAKAKSFRPAQVEPQKSYATLTRQVTRVISGTISTPSILTEAPQQMSPGALAKPFENLRPTDGYLSVEAPTPTPQGTANVTLPLFLRPARGPEPRFSIRYRSGGKTGVLGKGWDLEVSSIQVDTRHGVPMYHQEYETEDYVMDGQDLIALDKEGRDIPPLFKGGPIIGRITEPRVFRLRNNSGGLVVRRYGVSPAKYYWEVWAPNTHTTRLYGAKKGAAEEPISFEPNGILRDGAAAVWGLTQEYDNQPARSGSKYVYEADKCTNTWKDKCVHALRLQSVAYSTTLSAVNGTSVTEENEQESDAVFHAIGQTSVKFYWSERKTVRFTSDGRFGFLRVDEHWLESIKVSYDNPEGNGASKGCEGPTGKSQFQSEVCFSLHRFILSEGKSKTINFERVLKEMRISGNKEYDHYSSAEKQVFKFEYVEEGELKWKRADHNDIFGEGSARSNGRSPTGAGDLPLDRVPRPPALKVISDLFPGLGKVTTPSFLGTTLTTENGSSEYVGVGPGFNVFAKPTSLGSKVGLNFAKSRGLTTLADVTGDGIDDLIYQTRSSLRYCKGRRLATMKVNYPKRDADCGSIEGIPEFYQSVTESKSAALEGFAPANTFGAAGVTDSINETYVYFTHADGDRLIDLVQFGQVFYGQGEQIKKESQGPFVLFSPRSALIPPVPDHVGAAKIEGYRPEGLVETAKKLREKLVDSEGKIDDLEHAQKVIVWEAPLDGIVTISGIFQFKRGNGEFDKVREKVKHLQKYASDVLDKESGDDGNGGGNQNAKPPLKIDFIPELEPKFAIWRSRRGRGGNGVHLCVAEASLSPQGTNSGPAADIFIANLAANLPQKCLDDSAANGRYPPFDQEDQEDQEDVNKLISNNGPAISVKMGDAIYVTYNSDGDYTSIIEPKFKISYLLVEGDEYFNHRRLRAFRAKIDSNSDGTDQSIDLQSRYTFDFPFGLLETTHGQAIEIKPGTDRTILGRLSLPGKLGKDYSVKFEVLAAKEGAFLSTRPWERDYVTIASVPLTCKGGVPDCEVDMSKDWSIEQGTEETTYFVTSRLVFSHRGEDGADTGVPPLGIDGRLSGVVWLEPPRLQYRVKEEYDGKPARKIECAENGGDGGGQGAVLDERSNPPADKLPQGDCSAFFAETPHAINVYLPVTMGTPDTSYFKVRSGEFDGNRVRPNFEKVLAGEGKSLEVAEYRILFELCEFGKEITRYAGDQGWATEKEKWAPDLKKHEPSCEDAEDFLKDIRPRIEGIMGPEKTFLLKNIDRLDLEKRLQGKQTDDQKRFSEALFRRVLKNLKLPRYLYVDHYDVSKQGYRLPVKANPLDCSIVAKADQSPSEGTDERKGLCKFRISLNFAMEVRPAGLTSLQKSLASEEAFRLTLRAEVNEKPVVFRELSRATDNEAIPEENGNNGGTNQTADRKVGSCLEAYGKSEERFSLRYLNGRWAQATAFSDRVMAHKPLECSAIRLIGLWRGGRNVSIPVKRPPQALS